MRKPMAKATRPYRYTYVNRVYLEHGAEHGDRCNPVRREDGKCMVSSRHALVTFEDGVQAVVIRRCLRLVKGE